MDFHIITYRLTTYAYDVIVLVPSWCASQNTTAAFVFISNYRFNYGDENQCQKT